MSDDEDVVCIPVTADQVEAARIEAQAFRSAGLEPDPLVVKMANARRMEPRAACGLCGLPGPFRASSNEVPLHHVERTVEVGRRADGSPVLVTCYEAWTVYDRRA